jgi:hypothetical protein
MIDKIKDYLETSMPSLSWVIFGSGTMPSPPYGVLKGERKNSGRGIRVILHRNQGEQENLEDDLRETVASLSNKGFTSRNGNYNQLGRLIEYSDVMVVSDDNTISMEALFLMPTTSF